MREMKWIIRDIKGNLLIYNSFLCLYNGKSISMKDIIAFMHFRVRVGGCFWYRYIFHEIVAWQPQVLHSCDKITTALSLAQNFDIMFDTTITFRMQITKRLPNMASTHPPIPLWVFRVAWPGPDTPFLCSQCY